MSEKFRGLLMVWVAILVAVAGCASQQPLVTVGLSEGETVVEVKASNFRFEPNNIKAYEGDVLVFRIDNTSDTGHNFTLKNPEGHILQSVPLPPKETETVKVDLSEPGAYEFYCDKTFHAAFGMKGRIEVVKKP